MAEFLEDPSVLTKDKLKGELTANNVPLPSGEHKKEVYVQLYLKNLTVLNKRSPSIDTFSSDDELPVSNKTRSGRKATRKTDKPRSEEAEVTDLTDEDLKDQLVKLGVNPGPIVGSTRKLYEKRLQKLRDQPAPETAPIPPETPSSPPETTPSPPETTPSAPEITPSPPETTPSPPENATALITDSKADSNQNGNTHSNQYSDEEEETVVPDPEPVPVVEKPVRSRGKTPVTLRASSRRHTKVEEQQAAGDQTPKKSAENVVEDILANEISAPIGISATCRRPIRGAAGRPVKPSSYWLNETLLERSAFSESQSERLSRADRPGKAPAPAPPGPLALLLRLLLLLTAAGSLYYAYESLDAEQMSSLKSLLDRVAAPLGLGGEGVAQGSGKK